MPCRSTAVPELPVADQFPPPIPAQPEEEHTSPEPPHDSVATPLDPPEADESPLEPPQEQNQSSLPPMHPAAPRAFTSRQERTFANRGGPVPRLPPNPSPTPASGPHDLGGVPTPRRRVLSFSNPQRGNFSYQRRKPDVSALNAIIRSYLS